MKHLGRQSHALMPIYKTTIRCVDTRTLLPPMLEGKEPEERNARRVLISINGKDAAFFLWLTFRY
jgi:hypothetical protein